MKLLPCIQSRGAFVPGIAIRAFTLLEIMIVASIFSLLVAATISSQLFGLRMYCISEVKLSTTAEARGAFNRVRDEIRSGKLLYVGNGNSSTFTLFAENAPHIGNALKICATTDTNNYVYYYLDAEDSCLKRMVSSNREAQIVAQYVTNQLGFRAEDFQGNVVSNYQNNRVIQMTLEFYRREFATGQAKGGMFDYYRLQTRVARRAKD